MEIHWERPRDEHLQWRLMGGGQTLPMVAAVLMREFAAYARGFSEYGGPPYQVRLMLLNGYLYKHQVKPDPVAMRAWEENRPEALAQAAARPLGYWRDEMLPELQQALARHEQADLGALSYPELLSRLEEALTLNERVEVLHQPIIAMEGAARRFQQLHAELFGESGPPLVALLQGLDNRLVHMNRELARLSAVLPGEFDGEFARFLDAFGRRFDFRDLTTPTWREDPTAVLHLLQGVRYDPVAGQERQAAERETAEAEVRRRLASSPPAVQERYLHLLQAAREAAIVLEDHNVWMDQRCRVPIRELVLEIGRRLAATARMEREEDIWWLMPADLEGVAALLGVVAERKALWTRYASVQAPAELGAVSAPVPAPAATEPPAVLRGVAASGGVVRGMARVVTSAAQGVHLRAGEVLVVPSLYPSMTPLMGRAAAVVADMGGVLSHGALLAREFGIPAVVGTGQASRAIRDGQLVEVDGNAGTVSLTSS